MPRVFPLFSRAVLLVSALTAAYAVASPEAEAPEYVELEARAPAQVISRCTVPNTVALTFDDGPYLYTRAIVDQLEAVGGKATFFVNGNNWGCIYDPLVLTAASRFIPPQA